MNKLSDIKNQELEGLMTCAKLILRKNKYGETIGGLAEVLAEDKIKDTIKKHNLKGKIILTNFLERKAKAFKIEHKRPRTEEELLTIEAYDYIHSFIVEGISKDFAKSLILIQKAEKNSDKSKLLCEKLKFANYTPRLSQQVKDKIAETYPLIANELSKYENLKEVQKVLEK